MKIVTKNEWLALMVEGGLKAILFLTALLEKYPHDVWVKIALGVLNGERWVEPYAARKKGYGWTCAFVISSEEYDETQTCGTYYIADKGKNGQLFVGWHQASEARSHLGKRVWESTAGLGFGRQEGGAGSLSRGSQ